MWGFLVAFSQAIRFRFRLLHLNKEWPDTPQLGRDGGF